MNFEPHDLLEPLDLPTSRLKNTDAEQGVLSILLNFPAAFDDVSDRLKAEHFSADWLRKVYTELSSQMASGRGCDFMTVAERVSDAGITLQEMHKLSQSHDHSARAIGKLVDIVIERYKSRQLHKLSGKLATLAFETTPVQDRIDQAQAELMKLDDVTDADDWIDAHEGAIKHLDLIEQREAGTIKGIETGLHDFDEMLDGGMQKGNLIIIGARPSMGKTALAITMGLHMAQQHVVGLLSMEMPHSEVRDRQTAILGGIGLGNIKRPKKGLQFDRVVEAVEKARNLKFFVSDKSGLNILQVRSKARALKRRHGLEVLIVDYLGLMNGLDSKQNRAYQIEEITRGLKGLAKELDIVVVALAQVNRGGAESATQVPGLTNIRDSGAIEQDADVVAFVHRPFMADPAIGADFEHYGLLRTAKNRQGRCGDVHLYYAGEQTKFSSWSGPAPSTKTVTKGRGFE